MNLNKIANIKNKKILFLQGPMGSFFSNLNKIFLKAGAQTHTIGFNAGDYFFSSKHNYVPYRGTPSNWPDFIKTYLNDNKIDIIFLFGDCRYYHAKAIYVAKNLDIEVFVFEEGYIRPDYITMERYGVNDYSKIPRSADFYKKLPMKKLPDPSPAKSSGFLLGYSAALYYILADYLSFLYPHYKHHRDLNANKEFYLWIRSGVRKYLYLYKERGIKEKVEKSWSKCYFFVPLQTHNDFQILQHSPYRSVEIFIDDVLKSFSKHAPDDLMLIFKHHPVDRGRKDYTDFIMRIAKKLNISQRVKVVHDVHLPTLLKHAIGTVTINSTVGLSSLYHNTPVLAMGNAIYGFKGMSKSSFELDTFWSDPGDVNQELYQKFRNYLIENTQLNGSFYGKLPKLQNEISG